MMLLVLHTQHLSFSSDSVLYIWYYIQLMMLGLHSYHLIGLPLNCIILMDVVSLLINLNFEMLQLEAF